MMARRAALCVWCRVLTLALWDPLSAAAVADIFREAHQETSAKQVEFAGTGRRGRRSSEHERLKHRSGEVHRLQVESPCVPTWRGHHAWSRRINKCASLSIIIPFFKLTETSAAENAQALQLVRVCEGHSVRH